MYHTYPLTEKPFSVNDWWSEQQTVVSQDSTSGVYNEVIAVTKSIRIGSALRFGKPFWIPLPQ